ncbi:Major allergen Alt a 1 [Plenodomus lindquistii]|nr:Major allergen Alt a 1 [Plenodomus lindquistii]
MQFTTIAASLLAVAGLSAAAPLEARESIPATCPVAQKGDYVWKISNFSARKNNGKDLSNINFNIKATNGGTLDFNCGAQANKLIDGKFYQCGQNSGIWFAYQDDRQGLLIQQSVSDDIQYVATTTAPNVCRAGGNGAIVCTGVSDAYITLVQYPKLGRPTA